MARWNPFSAIVRRFRGAPPPPPDLLEAYAQEVIPVLDRAEWLYQYWLEQASLFSDGEKLGNVAAIHRWEAASMERSLDRVIPPAVLADAHDRVLDALETASRAAQLLSGGSRFHNANALCEGWSLLESSRERRLAALRAMRRYLAPRLTARPEPEAGAEVEPAVTPARSPQPPAGTLAPTSQPSDGMPPLTPRAPLPHAGEREPTGHDHAPSETPR